jgi:hypothetical protein
VAVWFPSRNSCSSTTSPLIKVTVCLDTTGDEAGAARGAAAAGTANTIAAASAAPETAAFRRRRYVLRLIYHAS